MNGTRASGLVIGLGWRALGGIVEEKPDEATKPYVWSEANPNTAAPAKRTAVSLGRPVPVVLEKPRPLSQEPALAGPKAPEAPGPFSLIKRAARKPIFRAQSLEDLPPS